MTDQELFEIERLVILNYKLTQFEKATIEKMLPTLRTAQEDLLGKLGEKIGSSITKARLKEVLNEINSIFYTCNKILGDSTKAAVTETFGKTLKYHQDTLSLFDSIPVVKQTISPEMLQVLFNKEVGSMNFKKWVESVYEKPITNELEQFLNSGILEGKSYRELSSALSSKFDVLNDNATTMVRTWVHGTNVEAMEETYKNNPALLQDNKVVWQATLENGYKNTGHGTCLTCASLDGTEYDLKNHPPIPLHPRCRCVLLPKCKTWKELGLSDDKQNEMLRAYSLREDKAIGTGGTRKILGAGQTDDTKYGEWIMKQSEKIQKQSLGINRYNLIQDGKIKFDDLVNKSTGKLRTLEELKQL
jgi:hypothetical protein